MMAESTRILFRDFESGEVDVVKDIDLDALSRVIATLRHELGNPVNAVSTMLRLLRRKHTRLSEEKLDQYLERSLLEMERLRELIQSLTRAKRLEDYKKQRFALSPFMKQLSNHLDSRAGGLGFPIAVDVDPPDAEVVTDPRALQYALRELLQNSVDAVADKEDPLVSLSVLRHPEALSFRIEDNGHGLGEEARERFHEPLWTTREDHDGMGGIVALTAVAAMGGSLEIIDRERRGVVMILHLPGDADELS